MLGRTMVPRQHTLILCAIQLKSVKSLGFCSASYANVVHPLDWSPLSHFRTTTGASISRSNFVSGPGSGAGTPSAASVRARRFFMLSFLLDP